MEECTCCRGGLKTRLLRKLGRCPRCMRLAALSALASWAAAAALGVVWPQPVALGLGAAVAACFTALLLAHVVAFMLRAARRRPEPDARATARRAHALRRRALLLQGALVALLAVFAPPRARPLSAGGTPTGTPSGTPSGSPSATQSGTPSATPSGTPTGTPTGTPPADPCKTGGCTFTTSISYDFTADPANAKKIVVRRFVLRHKTAQTGRCTGNIGRPGDFMRKFSDEEKEKFKGYIEFKVADPARNEKNPCRISSGPQFDASADPEDADYCGTNTTPPPGEAGPDYSFLEKNAAARGNFTFIRLKGFHPIACLPDSKPCDEADVKRVCKGEATTGLLPKGQATPQGLRPTLFEFSFEGGQVKHNGTLTAGAPGPGGVTTNVVAWEEKLTCSGECRA